MKFNFFQQLRAVCDGPGRKWGQEPDVASHSTHVEPMYYEVLDISLQELEQLKTLKVGSSRPPAVCFDLVRLALVQLQNWPVSGATQIPEAGSESSWRLLRSGQPFVTCHCLGVSTGTGCCCCPVCHLKKLLCAQLGVGVAALLCALLPVLCKLPPAPWCTAATLQ